MTDERMNEIVTRLGELAGTVTSERFKAQGRGLGMVQWPDYMAHAR